MAWIQLKVDVAEQDAQSVGDLMSGNGAQAVTFTDAKDNPIFEPPPGELLLWPTTTVMGLFDADFDMQAVLKRMSQAKVLGPDFPHKLDQLEDKDWEREWMDNFKPMRFGNKLWICPSWCDIPDPEAVNILLDPGLAFGTGTHPTTSLCLQWLDGQDLTGKTVLDFGCGSGILGIAAIKLGAARVIGVDIDKQALEATAENARRNDCEADFELYLPEQQPDAPVDLVLANILAGPLRELRSLIASQCKPGASLVLSGILETQAAELNTLYQEDFFMEEPAFQDEWSRLVGVKR